MFGKDESGGVMVIFGLALPALLAGIAGMIEITRAESYKQRLTSATELACNQGAVYINRENENNALKNYTSEIQTIANKKIIEKDIGGATITSVPSPAVSATNVRVSTTGTMNYMLGAFLPQSSFQYSVIRDCSTLALASGIPPESKLLFSEGFETGHTVPSNDWNVLTNWNGWTTQNAGVEINGQRSVSGTAIAQGNFFAELDSDCNRGASAGLKGCQSNSSLTRTMNLKAGDYEIRYWYKQRGDHPSAYNTTICADLTKPQGNQRSDSVAYADKDGQTYRVEVYVDDSNDSLFTKSNLVDVCVNSPSWVERKINFKLTKKDDYRISWRATDSANSGGESYGGLIDYIRICQGTCP